MPRTILIHLSVAVADADTRTADEVADRVVEFVSSLTVSPQDEGMLSIVATWAGEEVEL